MIWRAKWKSIKYGEIEGYAYEYFVENELNGIFNSRFKKKLKKFYLNILVDIRENIFQLKNFIRHLERIKKLENGDKV
jgi:hypothetical protein